MLCAVGDAIDEDRLRGTVPAWVGAVRYYREVDSTHRVAADWAAQGAPHGSLVLTDHQTAGRGRLSRSWLAPPGSSLLFSVILRPASRQRFRGLLPLAAGVAVCESLRRQEIDAYLKWPNDVLVDGAKIAGILAEAVNEAVLVGVGVNVNQESVAPELRDTATSMSRCAGRRFDRLDVLEPILTVFGDLYAALPQGLLDRYRPMCRTLGLQVLVECAGESVEDVAQDIDERGALVLAGGRVVEAGDVIHLRPGGARNR